MKARHRKAGRLRWGVRSWVTGLALAVSVGCGDLETAPTVQLRGSDPVVSLFFSGELQVLPYWVDRWGPGLGLEGLVEGWYASWDGPLDEGRATRATVIRAAVPSLAAVIPGTSLESAVSRLRETLHAAEEALGTPLSEWSTLPIHSAMEGTLVEAADHVAQAEGAVSKEVRLLHVLLASDLLRSTTADSLARLFLAQASGELRRISSDRPYSDMTVLRADRLIQGAHEALETGEPFLALQRAWYAVGLLRSEEERERLAPGQGR